MVLPISKSPVLFLASTMKPSNVAVVVEINCTVERKGYGWTKRIQTQIRTLVLYVQPTYNGGFLQTDRCQLFPLESIHFLHLLFPPISAHIGMGRHIPWETQPAPKNWYASPTCCSRTLILLHPDSSEREGGRRGWEKPGRVCWATSCTVCVYTLSPQMTPVRCENVRWLTVKLDNRFLLNATIDNLCWSTSVNTKLVVIQRYVTDIHTHVTKGFVQQAVAIWILCYDWTNGVSASQFKFLFKKCCWGLCYTCDQNESITWNVSHVLFCQVYLKLFVHYR